MQLGAIYIWKTYYKLIFFIWFAFCSLTGYVSDILDDARVYSSHANKKTVDADDVKLAIQCRMDHSFTSPPPRDVNILII